MQAYGIRVPNVNRLEEALNQIEQAGGEILFAEVIVSGQVIVVAHSTVGELQILLESGEELLQENGNTIIA